MIEIMLQKLYQSRGLSDQTDFKLLGPEDYPTLSEMYDFIECKSPFTPNVTKVESVMLVCPLKNLDSAPLHMECSPRRMFCRSSAV